MSNLITKRFFSPLFFPPIPSRLQMFGTCQVKVHWRDEAESKERLVRKTRTPGRELFTQQDQKPEIQHLNIFTIGKYETGFIISGVPYPCLFLIND